MTAIAVLGGTGALGSALVRRWARAGHTIWIGSRDSEKAKAAAAAARADLGREIYGADLRGAAEHAAIVVFAVPYASHVQTIEAVLPHCTGKVVIDTTVPLKPPKVGTVQLPQSGSAAVEAQRLLGAGVQVVSALQTVSAEKLSRDGEVDCDVLVSGDDKDAVATVMGLIADLGLRAFHAGPLANSAASEALTSVLIQLNRKYFSHAGIRVTGDPKNAPARPAISIIPVAGIGMVKAQDDLAAMIREAIRASGEQLRDGDAIVVAQKIVSKAEGRVVRLADVTPAREARELAEKTAKDPRVLELILRESQAVMRAKTGVVIARHRLGHVAANAGIDASNVEPAEGEERVLLWPLDPDASAAALRDGLQKRSGVKDIAVIISDSIGRAWRIGTAGTAIGCAGIEPLLDRRGEADLFGRVLQATIVGRADEIAAAASLAIGEAAEATPVAIVRGAHFNRSETNGIQPMLRPIADDLFR